MNQIDIIYENTYCDYSLHKASDSDIAKFKSLNQFTLEEEYLNFLKSIDGFELNGLNFYGTKENKGLYVLNAMVQNELWSKELPKLKQYYILGDGDMDFYCFNPVGKEYIIFDKGGLNKVTEFKNFELLLIYLIEVYV